MAASLLFAAVGLIAVAALFVANDPSAIAHATLSIGAGGFALLVAWQILLYLPLGAAWRIVAPRAQLTRFVWARAVREGAGNCLPFSVVGGAWFGARALAGTDTMPFDAALLSSITDLTMEFAAQIGFAAVALACLMMARPDAPVADALLAALAIASILVVAVLAASARLRAPLRRLSVRIGRRLTAQPEAVVVAEPLDPGGRHIALAIGLHLAAWFGAAAALWLILGLLGHPISPGGATAVEGLMCLMRAASFMLPAGIGVQEASYVALGAHYGIPADLALAASLIRRGREILLGLPVLFTALWPRRQSPAGDALPPKAVFAHGVRIADAMLDRAGMWTDKPSMAAALELAAADGAAGASLREPLEQWIGSLREEADLNALGRYSAHWDIMRLLDIRRRFAEEEAAVPAILAEPVVAPLFIIGMPRSGSTFLHSVLAHDSANLVPRCWQALAPYPPRAGRDRRAHQARFQLGMFNRMSPGLASLHPLTADAPQECSELMAPSLRSLRFDTTHNVPSYRRWLDDSGHLPAYAFLRRTLQHLQHQQGPGRWVLKCPDHVFAIDALLEVFPDARFVMMHRDPLKVLPSAAKLTELLRRPFTRAIDRHALGRHVVRDWLDGAQRIVRIADALPADRLIHIHHRPFTRAPAETIRQLYAHLDWEMAPGAASLIDEACSRPRGGYGRNLYRFSDFGIDAAHERERFRPYIETFAIDEEAMAL